MAVILDGKALNEKIKIDLKKKIEGLISKPKLVIVQVGDNQESEAYIERKKKFGADVGAEVIHQKYSVDISESSLIGDIEKINQDKSVNGIIVQLPLPKSLNKNKIINSINPQKDVDGQTPESLKSLIENEKGFLPATTRGIFSLLKEYKINLSGKKVVIVGRSTLVGKPTALKFLNENSTVTICHSQTEDLEKETKRADILVIAIGKPALITKDFVSPDQIVIDVGINVIEGKLKGDVDFEDIKDEVGFITPVPGGVGPMTVASLFENLFEACQSQV